MKRSAASSSPVFCILLVVLFLWHAVAANAASWPQWRGPNRDGTTSQLAGTWPPPEKLWQVGVGDSDSSPILINGRVYVMELNGGKTGVKCLDAETGDVLWTNGTPGGAYGRYAEGDQPSYTGPEATPACDGTRLFTLSSDGDLYCFNATSGATNWGFNLYARYGMGQRPSTGGGLRDYGYTSSPMLCGDNVLVEVGGSAGVVGAFRKTDGALVDSWGTGYPGHSSGPAGPDGKVFVTLTHLWINGTQIPWQTEYGCNLATPAVSENYVVFSSEYNHKTTACYNVSGSLQWSTASYYAIVHSPVIHESAGNVYMPEPGRCLNLANGNLKWSFGGSSAVIVTGDDKVIIFDSTIDLYNTSGTKLAETNAITRGWPGGAFGEGKLVYKNRSQVACWSVGTAPTPEIAVSTTNLAVSCQPGQNAAGITFEVWNSGEGTLTYTATNNGSGKFQVSPASGSSSGPADKQVHTITWSTSGMSEGYQERTAAVSDNGSGASNGPIDIHLGISVRPGVLDRRVAAGSDDAEERVSDGQVSLDSGDLELIRDGTNDQLVAVRFLNVAIPKGAALSNTFVQFKVDETAAESTALTIRGELNANAATFTSNETANISSRPTTVTAAAWSPPAWDTAGAAGLDQQTADLSAVLQEVVDQAGWVSGNALALVIAGVGKRTAEAHNGDAAGAPLLHVEFTGGAEDTDGDAMADSWENTYFGGTSQTNGGPLDDKDGDGYLNLDEYVAGSDPTNEHDSFQIEIVVDGGQLVVRHPTLQATGTDYDGLDRYYGMECAPYTTGTWSAVPGFTNRLGNNEPLAFTNTAPGTCTFYRVNTRLR
ncbi:MAG: PQQ-binding-like beta-propeller repeat protein [Kiritimatiellae bacterium]|nr:PQQ-binding-like beta-propeller repeat protein [Kiritimatiellia bacterium]